MVPLLVNKMESNGLELQQSTFKFDVRKNFLMVRLIKHWNKGEFKQKQDKQLYKQQ